MADPPSRRPPNPEKELRALEALAASEGIELAHRDGFEREVRPSPEVLAAVLRAVGLPLDHLSRAPELLRRAREEERQVLLPPVLTARAGVEATLPLRGRSRGRRLELRIRTEGGEVWEWFVDQGEEPRTPKPVPAGYHEVELRVGSRSASSVLISTPPRALQRPDSDREWGVFLPLYALRRQRSWGLGDLGGLESLLRWLQEQGGDVVGTLPLFAAFVDRPLDPSPYAPVSRLFWNELYLNPEELPEWEGCAAAQELWASPSFQEAVRRVEESSGVAYPEVARLRYRLLDLLAERWRSSGGEQNVPFRRFLEAKPEVLHYARFRAAVSSLGPPGSAWVEEWRRSGIPEGAYDEAVRLRHLYAQFRMATSLDRLHRSSARGTGLYLDLPLGSHPAGFDVWSNPGLFAQGTGLGAPPDGFQTEGQNWGLPPLRPRASREEGHRHLRRVLRTLLPHARALRIDHVMGLHRLYWVPEGFKSGEGAYVRYPARELWAILALESHRNRTALFGEDLGTVPGEVREAMDEVGVGRSFVVPFSIRPEEPRGLDPVPPGAVATLNTHDLPPFAAFWTGRDLGEGIGSGALDEETARREEGWREECRRALSRAAGVEWKGEAEPHRVLSGLLEWLGGQPAALVLASLEDLWSEVRPQNRPGTSHPENWRGRARLTLEELALDPRVLEPLERLRRARKGDA